MEKAYQKSSKDIEKELGTNIEKGLTQEEVEKRYLQYGINELVEPPKEPIWKMFLGEFNDPLVMLLLFAIVISIIFGDIIEAIVIALIVILNSILGFTQEYRAENALEALKKMVSKECNIIRNSEFQRIDAKKLVPGDLVLLEAGDIIPADIRLVETERFKTEEASLTGESTSVNKNADAVFGETIPVAEQKNMTFMGTTAVYGKAKGIVASTGMKTEFGKIAARVSEQVKEETPLQQQLTKLGKVLGIVIVVIIGIVFVLEMIYSPEIIHAILALNFTPEIINTLIDLFETSIALAISAVPEGLPAAITITMAIGVQRMVKRNAIIRKLPAVETLGAVDIICSDKTGTLTLNMMTVREIWTVNGTVTVTGEGYEPKGEFLRNGTKVDPKADKDLFQALRIGSLCNNSKLLYDAKESKWKVIGDPTEGCLRVIVEKAKLSKEFEQQKRIAELFFDSNRKRMTSIDGVQNFKWANCKGSPGIILERCSHYQKDNKIVPLTDEIRKKILDQNTKMSSNALRVLGLAFKSIEGTNYDEQIIEKDMVFVGLVGMIDPPRPEVYPAIEKCRHAGIKTVMITGDQAITARAIAIELKMIINPDECIAISDQGLEGLKHIPNEIREMLLSEGKQQQYPVDIINLRTKLCNYKSLIITGQELDEIPNDILPDVAEKLIICARASPENKMRIVEALKSRGHVVAVTGDGVNDAPALKKADIGVAMGITGTDVTKEVADMILTDDNFASIVNAVEEGRGIYDNMRKFIRFLISCNFDEIATVFIIFSVLQLGLPLLAIQLLWINLLTDGLPAIALAMDPMDPHIMERKPRARKSSLVRDMMLFSMVAGFLAFLASMAAYLPYALQAKTYGENLGLANIFNPDFVNGVPVNDLYLKAITMAFMESIIFEKFVAFLTRREEQSLFLTNPFENKLLVFSVLVSTVLCVPLVYIKELQQIFHTSAITLTDWGYLIVVTLVCILILDIAQYLMYKYITEKKEVVTPQ